MTPSGKRPFWQKYLGLLALLAIAPFLLLYAITGNAAIATLVAGIVVVTGVIGGVLAAIFGALRDRTRGR